jgi:hypothetical protein
VQISSGVNADIWGRKIASPQKWFLWSYMSACSKTGGGVLSDSIRVRPNLVRLPKIVLLLAARMIDL